MKPTPKRARLLIVDDTPGALAALQASLEEEYELVTATNGAEAIEAATAGDPPDLILLDVTMPDLDGYEVCRRLREDPKTQDIPVIFQTALLEEEEEVKGLALGAVDFIRKPFNPDVLRARVGAHLDRWDALRGLEGNLDDALERLEAARREYARLYQQ